MADHSRRRLLQGGSVAVISALAGCSSVTDQLSGDSGDGEPDPTNTTEERKEQQYTIPPVAELQGDGVPEDGTVPVEAIFEPATTPGDPYVYFEDELTSELFVYDTYPVGNNISLTKVAEKTSTPYETIGISFEVPFSELPKNEQMRFRLKITNNETGDSEWQMDQRVFFYGEFGETMVASAERYSVIEDEGGPLKRNFIQSGDSYVMDYWGGREFPSSEIVEEVPYCREAYKTENDLYRSGGPVCDPFKGARIEMPQSHVELSEQLMQQWDVSGSYNGLTFTANTPSEYDYYGRDRYDVLDNPIYQSIADTIDEAHESYGVNNHYSKIEQATATIQTNEYGKKRRSITDLPVHLPEAYWADPNENCVGHTYQMCWLLYHLGYTCGTVSVDLNSGAGHMGVGIPVPEEVMESQFPEGYPDTFTDGTYPSTQYISDLSGIVDPDAQPDTLGEYPWIYIEATDITAIGVNPFVGDNRYGGVESMQLDYAIEPEDNVFGTDIGVDNG